jgi:hypothetical protein
VGPGTSGVATSEVGFIPKHEAGATDAKLVAVLKCDGPHALPVDLRAVRGLEILDAEAVALLVSACSRLMPSSASEMSVPALRPIRVSADESS